MREEGKALQESLKLAWNSADFQRAQSLAQQAMRETAQIAIPMPNIPEMDVMWTVMSKLLTDVNLSGRDVDESFDEAMAEAENLIANMK